MPIDFYITTPIYYASGKPHLGHALCTLATDIVARWKKLNGEKVFFLTGTDEHGQKIATKAAEVGDKPDIFAAKMSEEFKKMNDNFGIQCDRFIRTTDTDHIAAAQEIWRLCTKNGDIYKKKYSGWYCVGCECFKTEKDLVNGLCQDHQTKPEWIEDENYFFAMSKYANVVANKIKSGELQLIPESRCHEILNFIESGVEDISISRSRKRLEWGIPVPGDDTQVMYVWFDALTNYLTATGWPDKNYREIWLANTTHVLGREILRHHALMWPAMLMSAKIEMPKKIVSHGMITVDGLKMSKTIGNIVAPQDLIDKYGRDASRYIIMSEIRFLEDGDFSWQRADVRYKELANNLGNMLSRVLTLGEKLSMQKAKNNHSEDAKKIHDLISNAWTNTSKAFDEFRFRDATQEINNILDFANKLLEQEKPWELIKSDPERAKKSIFMCFEILSQVMWMITPIMPQIAEEMSKQLGLDWKEQLKPNELNEKISLKLDKIGDFKKGSVLFPRIENSVTQISSY
ncbi:MAG: methionine--tRNA ligase [Patescibacteria group bacterium]|nr:methionine--tRNA ligase [Patescibacteria group bacterium]